MLVEDEPFGAWPPLEVCSDEFFLREDLILPSHTCVIPVIRLNGDNDSIPDMGLEDTVMVAAAITVARSVYNFITFVFFF